MSDKIAHYIVQTNITAELATEYYTDADRTAERMAVLLAMADHIVNGSMINPDATQIAEIKAKILEHGEYATNVVYYTLEYYVKAFAYVGEML